MKAPATAVIGYDLEFYAHPPQGQGLLAGFADQPDAGARWLRAQRLAARRLFHRGRPRTRLDAGSGREFFAGTSVGANFPCNVGYGDPAALRPRGPRVAFEEAAQILWDARRVHEDLGLR
jgi:3-hydroxypropanoate dehydrogenase